MQKQMPFCVLVLSLVVLGASSAGLAQSQQPQQLGGSSPLYWGVDQIMDNYIKQMTRYYNLTPEQEEYTRGLMSKRVKQFLSDYEKDVRWLAAEMFDYQMKKEMPPAEIAKEWGTRGRPLLNAIRQEVMSGNQEWRKVLNEAQLKQHDRDLELMEEEFNKLTDRFERWSHGDVQPTDFPGAVSNQPRTVRRNEDAWQYYVRYFIQTYNLDEGQRQTAYSALRELQEEAKKYREAHKDRYAKLDAVEAQVAASGPKTDPEELKHLKEQNAKLAQQRRELDRPISEGMFNRLKNMLEAIPTSDQRLAREQKLAKLNSFQPPAAATRPAVVAPPTTQPTADASSN